jgi:hypothetical protein
VTRQGRLSAVLPVVLCAVLLGLGSLEAASPAAPGYADSVDQALHTARQAGSDDRQAARLAADQLEGGTGQSQPEILSELRADPPNLGDARVRLAALSGAARSPAFTPEPGRARAALREILADPRYADLQSGSSLGDRLAYWALLALVWLLQRLGHGGLPLLWALGGAGAATLIAVAVLLALAARGRGRREAQLADRSVEEIARDRFAEADRLASQGDLTAAVRALAGAVAAALGDHRDWDRSALTVREIFSRADDPARLRPLLLVFEAAVYGAVPPDSEAYARAGAAAAPFRRRADPLPA